MALARLKFAPLLFDHELIDRIGIGGPQT